jgi:hypothetical protein
LKLAPRSLLATASLLLACLLAGGGGIGAAAAATVTLEPVRDNTLFEDPDGTLSSGAGDFLFAGRTSRGSLRRALVAFDIAGAIPTGVTIASAELTVHLTRGSGGPQPVGLHAVLADWGEGSSDADDIGLGVPAEIGDATWQHTFFDTDSWIMPGGDFLIAPSATTDLEETGYFTWDSTPELVADVQAWLDHPESNFGWLIRGNEEEFGTAKLIGARENADPALRPLLTVEYELACETDPVGPGYWHRQCLGLSVEENGLDPAGGGRGPVDPLEPGFVDEVLPCADDWLADLGLGVTTCEGLDPDPSYDPCEKALRKLTASVLNVCSGRTAAACPAPRGGSQCEPGTVESRIEQAAALILAGECRAASRCAAN